MQFELEKDAAPADGLADIYRALLDYARTCLENRDADWDMAVHEARKSLKMLRAVLRLVRPVLDKASYRASDRALRTIGRQLGGARDGAVLLVSFNRLVDHYAPFLDEQGMQPVREDLESRCQAATATFLASVDIHSLENQLSALRERLDAPDLGGISYPVLLASIRATYRNGRRALQILRDEPSTPNIHAFRRQVKYLWYQLRLLCNWNPAVLGPVVAQLDELGELLGQDHDLALLTDTLAAHPGKSFNRTRAELINGLAETRRIALLSAGLRIADGVYADKPACFTGWLETAIQDSTPAAAGQSATVRRKS